MEEILNILDKEKGNVSRAKIAQMLGMEERKSPTRLKKWKRKTLLSVTKPL